MSGKITVYEKPTCSKCREVDKILRESGQDYEKINYYVQPLDEQQLRGLIAKLGVPVRNILRTSDPVFAQLNLADESRSDDELIELMIKHPDLMQRPKVERGDKAVLGRPPENIRKLL